MSTGTTMASPPFAPVVPVGSLREIQELIQSGAKEIKVCFGGKIDRISEARAMAGLLDKAESEEGWEVDDTGLEAFVLIDRAISDSRNILIRAIKATKPAVDADLSASHSVSTATIDADLSASHSVGSSSLVLAKHSVADPGTIGADLSASHPVGSAKAKRSAADLFGSAADPMGMKKTRLSTAMSSPDYGTGAFAQRVADMLHGRSSSSPGYGDRVNSPARLASASASSATPARERLVIGNSPARERLVLGNSPGRAATSSLDAGSIISKGNRSPGPTADAGRISKGNRSPSPTADAGRISKGNRDITTPPPKGSSATSRGRRASASPSSAALHDSPSRSHLHHIGRPFGRFVTPDMAQEIQQAGIRLMKMPLLKVADLGEKFCETAKLLLRDKEGAEDLLKMVVELKKKSDNIWNSSSSVNDLVGRR